MGRNPKSQDVIGVKQKIMPKNLPEKWANLYHRRYTQLSSYYRKKKMSNPLLEILIERYAFISCYILYLESPDIKEDGNILSVKNLENYMAMQTTLNKQMDQIIRHLGTKDKELPDDETPSESNKYQSKKPSLTKEGTKELSDEKLKKRISDLVRKGKGGAGPSAD